MKPSAASTKYHVKGAFLFLFPFPVGRQRAFVSETKKLIEGSQPAPPKPNLSYKPPLFSTKQCLSHTHTHIYIYLFALPFPSLSMLISHIETRTHLQHLFRSCAQIIHSITNSQIPNPTMCLRLETSSPSAATQPTPSTAVSTGSRQDAIRLHVPISISGLC